MLIQALKNNILGENRKRKVFEILEYLPSRYNKILISEKKRKQCYFSDFHNSLFYDESVTLRNQYCYGDFQAIQSLVILQTLPAGMHDHDLPEAVDKAYPIRFLYLFEKEINVTAR